MSWFTPAGVDMTDADWGGNVHNLGLRLAGDLIDETDERGEPIVGDTLLVLMNARHESVTFTLPATKADQRWELVVDTGDGPPQGPDVGRFELGGRPQSRRPAESTPWPRP